MADMDKINVNELQDVTGGMENTKVDSNTELDPAYTASDENNYDW